MADFYFAPLPCLREGAGVANGFYACGGNLFEQFSIGGVYTFGGGEVRAVFPLDEENHDGAVALLHHGGEF